MSGTFAIEYLVVQGGGDVEAEEPAPAAVAAEEKPLSLARAGVGEQTPPAAAHTLPPLSPAVVG